MVAGLVYRALGFPPQFFTVMFAIPRVTGYLAHWRESLSDPDVKIARPQQDYRVSHWRINLKQWSLLQPWSPAYINQESRLVVCCSCALRGHPLDMVIRLASCVVWRTSASPSWVMSAEGDEGPSSILVSCQMAHRTCSCTLPQHADRSSVSGDRSAMPCVCSHLCPRDPTVCQQSSFKICASYWGRIHLACCHQVYKAFPNQDQPTAFKPHKSNVGHSWGHILPSMLAKTKLDGHREYG